MSNKQQLQNFANVGWKKMNVPDLINLCKTNSTMKKICDDPTTWKYLIKRDFGLDIDDEDPQQVYIRRKIYALGLKYNELANLYVDVVNMFNEGRAPSYLQESQKANYINGIIFNQQIALAALGLDNNVYNAMYTVKDSTSKTIEGIKVGRAFYDIFVDTDGGTVFEILDEMEFKVDDVIDFVKSNLIIS